MIWGRSHGTAWWRPSRAEATGPPCFLLLDSAGHSRSLWVSMRPRPADSTCVEGPPPDPGLSHSSEALLKDFLPSAPSHTGPSCSCVCLLRAPPDSHPTPLLSHSLPLPPDSHPKPPGLDQQGRNGARLGQGGRSWMGPLQGLPGEARKGHRTKELGHSRPSGPGPELAAPMVNPVVVQAPRAPSAPSSDSDLPLPRAVWPRAGC